MSVIVIHTVPSEFLISSYATLHFWQAVPLFLVIYGVNLSLSYSKSNFTSLKQYYGRNLLHRCKRVLPAFFITLLVAWIFCLIRGKFYFGWLTLIGVFPMGAPGNYFLTIILELLFVAPLLVYFYHKNLTLSLIIFLALDVLFELASPYILNSGSYYYHTSLFRILVFITLGLYLGRKLVNDQLFDVLHNRFIQVGVFVSVAYLAAFVFWNWIPPLFTQYKGVLNIWSVFYPFLIVSIVLNLKLERFKNGVIFNLITLIGKASYHIFLIQMLYFGLRYGSYNADGLVKSVLINLFITVGIGIAFYYTELYVWKLIDKIKINTLNPQRGL
jgi:hypothetical protein